MEEESLLTLASPEWSKNPDGDGVLCSQYGAYFAFHYEGQGGQLLLSFGQEYPDMRWTLNVDGSDQQTYSSDGEELTIDLPAGQHDVELVLDQWATGQVAFWQSGLVVQSIRVTGAVQLTSTLPNDEDKEATPYLTFVGDSIVAGEAMMGASHNQHRPSRSFPAIVARAKKQPLNRIAYGGTGLTTSAPFQEPKAIDALWRVRDDVARRRVHSQQVVVAYGLNDANYGASEEDFAFGLRVYLLELVKRFHQAHFYLLTPWNGRFKDIFMAEASRFDCFTVVDTSPWQISTRPHHPGVADHQKIAAELERIL